VYYAQLVMPLLLDQNVTGNAMLPYISPVEYPQPAKGCVGYPLNNFSLQNRIIHHICTA
jgi:hypothetical protein